MQRRKPEDARAVTAAHRFLSAALTHFTVTATCTWWKNKLACHDKGESWVDFHTLIRIRDENSSNGLLNV